MTWILTASSRALCPTVHLRLAQRLDLEINQPHGYTIDSQASPNKDIRRGLEWRVFTPAMTNSSMLISGFTVNWVDSGEKTWYCLFFSRPFSLEQDSYPPPKFLSPTKRRNFDTHVQNSHQAAWFKTALPTTTGQKRNSHLLSISATRSMDKSCFWMSKVPGTSAGNNNNNNNNNHNQQTKDEQPTTKSGWPTANNGGLEDQPSKTNDQPPITWIKHKISHRYCTQWMSHVESILQITTNLPKH